MKYRCCMALTLMLALMAGCAAETRHAEADNSVLGKELRKPEAHSLISECCMPCNVSPGPGCC